MAALKRIADTQKAYKPYLWNAAIGHLYALIGDHPAATSYLDRAEKRWAPTRRSRPRSA